LSNGKHFLQPMFLSTMKSKSVRVQASSIQGDIRSSRWWQLKRLASSQAIRTMILLISDLVALATAWHIAHFLNQFYLPIPDPLVWWVWLGLPSLFWVFAIATILLFIHFGLYGSTVRARDYIKASQLVSYIYLTSLVIAYFYNPKLDPPRSLFFSSWISSVGLVIFSRLVTHFFLQRWQQSCQPTSVFIIANASRLKRLSQTLETRSHYKIVGAAMASTANSPAVFQSILRVRPDEVMAEDVPNVELASGLYWRLRGAGIPLRLLPSSREMLYRRGMPEVCAGLPTLLVESSIFQTLDYRLKRWLDYLGAGLGIIVLLPLFLGIAISIKLSSSGPIFFRQERMGLHGKIFHVWKFRTMTVNASALQASLECNNESNDGILFKIRQDPRITPLGNFLRRTSLDELPQLFNVILGQMSLVGPRPLPLRDIAHFEPWHHIRHQVLPGMTGLWQISGRSEIENFDDAARLDLHYIDNWSLNLDLEILLATIKIVLFRQGAY
jgi:exopolysaccharide biosynthesis polyprenyl glycosylphosphotransferase